jgi:hypothetical protein
LGSRTGGALADEEAVDGEEELEDDADGELAEDAAEFDAGFEDELEQPVRERAAATTATAADAKEGRYLTMIPSVSGCGKGEGTAWNNETRGLQPYRSRLANARGGWHCASDLSEASQNLDGSGVWP